MQSRPSFYREVHKGIRSVLLDLQVKAGQTEWTDANALGAFRSEAAAAFELLTFHAHHEDKYIAPLLQKASPEVAKILGGSHDDQEETLDELMAQLAAVDSLAAGHQFSLALSRFVGESLVHMADEEEVAMTAIWNAFDDATILEAHGRLVSSIPPETMTAFMRWMIPALNPTERTALQNALKEKQHA